MITCSLLRLMGEQNKRFYGHNLITWTLSIHNPREREESFLESLLLNYFCIPNITSLFFAS